jgi:hypothetical protein
MDEELPPTAAPPAATCPPHYWLVEADPQQGDQHWVCRRCGAEQVHSAAQDDAIAWRRSKPPARGAQDPDTPA